MSLLYCSNNDPHLRLYCPLILGSVLISLVALFGLSANIFAQEKPDYLLGKLATQTNLTREQGQEVIDKVTDYLNSMLKKANGNQTKLNVLLIEDLEKRNITDEKDKQGLLSFIASLPQSPTTGPPGTTPGNLTIPGNVTMPENNIDLKKRLDTRSKLLDDMGKNSKSQAVTFMTDLVKKRITDTGNSGNGTDTGPVPLVEESTWAAIGKTAT